MKFWINEAMYRADEDGQDLPPVEEAEKVTMEWDEEGRYPKYTVEIKTLDDLVALSKRAGCPLVVHHKCRDIDIQSDEPSIKLYNDYLE